MPNPEDRHYTAAEISILQGFYGSNVDGWGSYWLKPNSNIVSWQKTVMTIQSGDILYANNVRYHADYSQLIVSDQLSAKQMHTFIHEAWHQKQASLTNWVEYVKVVGDDAKEGNYNYGAAFGNNDWKHFAHLSSEQQAEFFADYYLLKHGSASHINLSKKGGNVGIHTEAEYDALYTSITSGGLDRIVNETVKFDYSKDNKNGHQGGLGGSSMPDDWDADHKGSTVNSSLIELVVQSMKDAATYSSPLILDLDGDGIELVSLNSAYSVYFNIDSLKNDGMAEATGWFTGGDGALCIDINGDGIINNSSELFGNQTGYNNGFLALKVYDSNGDGFITSADSLWGNLRVWIENQVDGISETTEIHTLNELSISSVNLSYTDVNYTLSENTIKQQSTFVINGNSRNIVDAYFLYSDHNTINNSSYTLDERVVDLPDLRGYGDLPDLYIAESRSNIGIGNLLDLVSALENKTFSAIFDSTNTLKNDIRSILFKWAGVDGILPNSRGGEVNGQELAFLEKIMGQPFIQQGASSNPYGPEAGYSIQEAFYNVFNHYYARIVAQVAGGQIFTGELVYNTVNDSISGVTGIDTVKLNDLKTEALGLTTTAARQTFWENVVRMVEYSIGTNNLDAASKTALQNAITASDATLSLSGTILPALEFHRPMGVNETGTSGNDTMSGSSSDDVLDGANGNDTVNGLAGNDTLYGSYGDDILVGGIGSDYLKGGNGNDTYKYNLGDGSDTIIESGSGTGNDSDIILFGAGITLSNLSFQRAGATSLLITISGSSPGQIMIENQFNSNTAVEKIQFSDGSVYTLTDKNYTANGTSQGERIDGISYGGDVNDTIYLNDGDDVSYAGAGNDVVYGGNGNDIIYGEAGDDILSGGTGSNTVYGAEGNDVYIYSGGIDTFYDSYYVSGTDEIRMASGITSSMLSYTRVGNFDLRIDITGYGSITIKGQFGDYNSNQSIETIRFADNSTIDLLTKSYITQGTAGDDSFHGIIYGGLINDLAYLNDGNDGFGAGAGNDTVYGGNGNDNITGDAGDDILYGDAGNDILAGGDGNDILDGGLGDDTLTGGAGNDVYIYSGGIDNVRDDSGLDEIRMVSGITASMLTYTRINNFDLKIDVSGYGSITIPYQFWYYNSTQSIDTIRFADNSTIDLLTKSYVTQGTSGNDGLYGIDYSGSNNDVAYLGDGNDTFGAGIGNDIVYGGNGNDDLRGEAGHDALYGEAGNDILQGGDGNDILDGGLGDDTLTGGAGNDVYIYSGGIDNIRDDSGVDEIRMVSGITASMLTYTRINNFDLKIDVSGYGSITIPYQFWYYNSTQSIDTIRFADNSTIDLLTKSYVTQGTSGNDGLYGIDYSGSNNDVAYLGDGNDTFGAGIGNDIVYGQGGNDSLSGGNGDDILYGGLGDDILNGEANIDTASYADITAAVTVTLATTTSQNTIGAGLDTLTNIENLVGSAYNDTLTGDANANTIEGGAGNDNLNGSGGIDTVSYASAASAVTVNLATVTAQNTVGAGTDTIAAFENILGSAFNDTLTGDANANTIEGAAGNDNMNGAGGIDTASYAGATSAVTVNLSTTTAQNTVGAGTDTITAFENILGSAYNDTLTGDANANTITGGDGNDTIQGGLGNDVLVGGNGIDTLSYSAATAAITASLGTTAAQNTINAGTDTVSEFENIRGSAYDDTLTGDGNANIIEGGVGNDNLNGAGGIDTVSYVSATAAVTVNLATTTAQNTVGAGTDTLTAFENILGSAYNDTLTGDGNANTIEGGVGNDNLNGAGGIDTVSYASATSAVTINLATTTAQNTIGAGTDTIAAFENVLGSAYNDTLYGDANANILDGGVGNDLLEGKAGNDTIIGNAGIDTAMYVSSTVGVTVNLSIATAQDTIGAGTDTLSGMENLTGSAYNDTLTGDAGANVIDGGAGNDLIQGGLGDDLLMGAGGTDTLSYSSATSSTTVNLGLTTAQNTYSSGYDTISGFENLVGSAYADILIGDGAVNTITGGLGADVLTGALGGDIFKFSPAGLDANFDRITDFSTAQGDKIDLKDLLVGYDAVTSAITDFIEFTTVGANTVIKVDRDGAGTAYTWQQVAQLDNLTGLTDEAALKASGNLIVA